MKIKSFQIFCLMMAILFSVFISGGAFAEDPENDDGQETEETSAFQNPTQAQRAINIANAYAEKPDPELENALSDLEKAKQDLEEAQAEEDADDDTIGALEKAVDDAQEKADGLMAENGGVTAKDIGDMREEGMGWGEIAHELGLHPSVLGMGYAKAHKEQEHQTRGYGPEGKVNSREIEKATARNFKFGVSKGHGVSADKGSKSGNAGAKGIGAAKSNGNSGSNKGGNGRGNGNGGGNGKGGNGNGGGKGK